MSAASTPAKTMGPRGVVLFGWGRRCRVFGGNFAGPAAPRARWVQGYAVSRKPKAPSILGPCPLSTLGPAVGKRGVPLRGGGCPDVRRAMAKIAVQGFRPWAPGKSHGVAPRNPNKGGVSDRLVPGRWGHGLTALDLWKRSFCVFQRPRLLEKLLFLTFLFLRSPQPPRIPWLEV